MRRVLVTGIIQFFLVVIAVELIRVMNTSEFMVKVMVKFMVGVM